MPLWRNGGGLEKAGKNRKDQPESIFLFLFVMLFFFFSFLQSGKNRMNQSGTISLISGFLLFSYVLFTKLIAKTGKINPFYFHSRFLLSWQAPDLTFWHRSFQLFDIIKWAYDLALQALTSESAGSESFVCLWRLLFFAIYMSDCLKYACAPDLV